MFGKLKNKLKSWVGKISKEVEEVEKIKEKTIKQPKKEKKDLSSSKLRLGILSR